MAKKRLTYRELKKLFIDFLKKEKVHEQYLRNIRIQRKNEFNTLQNYIDPLTIETIRKAIQIGYTSGLVDKGFCWSYYMQLINYAFCWSDTPQGHNYWENLNDLWVDELRNFIINKFQKYQHETNNKKNIHRIGTT